MNAPFRCLMSLITGLLFGLLLGAVFAPAVKAQDLQAARRAAYFAAAKDAFLADGRRVNCCGEHDAVRVRITHVDRVRREAHAIIVDVMASKYGRLGDDLIVPLSLNTVELHSPFDDPIVFIRADNSPLCLSAPAGG